MIQRTTGITFIKRRLNRASEINLKQLAGKLAHYLTILLTSLLLFPLPVCGQNESPKHLLDEADRLAWLDN